MTRNRLWLPAILVLLASLSVIPYADAAGKRIDLPKLLAMRVPILLEFGRGWCIPCKYMKPILQDMSKAFSGKAVVSTVDMDANRNLVRQFRIRMMPTQVFLLPDGKEFFRNEGTLERDQITKIFAKMGATPSGNTRVGQAVNPAQNTPQAPQKKAKTPW